MTCVIELLHTCLSSFPVILELVFRVCSASLRYFLFQVITHSISFPGYFASLAHNPCRFLLDDDVTRRWTFFFFSIENCSCIVLGHCMHCLSLHFPFFPLCCPHLISCVCSITSLEHQEQQHDCYSAGIRSGDSSERNSWKWRKRWSSRSSCVFLLLHCIF